MEYYIERTSINSSRKVVWVGLCEGVEVVCGEKESAARGVDCTLMIRDALGE